MAPSGSAWCGAAFAYTAQASSGRAVHLGCSDCAPTCIVWICILSTQKSGWDGCALHLRWTVAVGPCLLRGVQLHRLAVRDAQQARFAQVRPVRRVACHRWVFLHAAPRRSAGGARAER